jgi:transposase
MFCPKCAAELVLQKGELTCLRGEMGLSLKVEHVLTERYGKHLPSPNRGVVSTTDPYPYYCPGCGVLLDAQMHCPECHLSLKDLQYEIVELHPHRRPAGGWR